MVQGLVIGGRDDIMMVIFFGCTNLYYLSELLYNINILIQWLIMMVIVTTLHIAQQPYASDSGTTEVFGSTIHLSQRLEPGEK